MPYMQPRTIPEYLDELLQQMLARGSRLDHRDPDGFTRTTSLSMLLELSSIATEPNPRSLVQEMIDRLEMDLEGRNVAQDPREDFTKASHQRIVDLSKNSMKSALIRILELTAE